MRFRRRKEPTPNPENVPTVVYAKSREEAQRLLDNSYLKKYVAVPAEMFEAAQKLPAAQDAEQENAQPIPADVYIGGQYMGRTLWYRPRDAEQENA